MAANKKPDPVPEGKVGVYVCHCGGNISDEVDVEKVCEQARKVPGVVVARANMFMCSDPGQELIIEDLKSGLVDRVVVASCSPSLHETTFRQALIRAGANPYIYEHANLQGAGELGAPRRRGHRKGHPAGGRGRGQGRHA